jgi:UDP-N-acetyl-D-mannosaminuronate dehydrogenase
MGERNSKALSSLEKGPASASGVLNISIFGLGKLGLPLAGLFASSGLRTVAIDVRSELIAQLQARDTLYAEPGLEDLLFRAESQISYSTVSSEANTTEASIILVQTPSNSPGSQFSSHFVEKACTPERASALFTFPIL